MRGVSERGSSLSSAEHRAVSDDGLVPLVGRFFPAPVAAKVPEVIFVFWVVKILTTAGGEATSDYLKTYGNFGGGGIEVLVIVVGLAAAVRHPPLPSLRLLVPGLRDRDHRDRRLGFPASRRPHPLRGDDPAVGGRPGRDLLALAAQRGHAVDPQHHDPATRGVLLGDGVRDLCPRDRARRLHRDLAQPRLPGLGHPLRGRHPDPGAGALAVRPERRSPRSGCPTSSRVRSVRPSPTTSASPRTSAGSTSATAPPRSCSPLAVFVLVSYLALARPDIQSPRD